VSRDGVDQQAATAPTAVHRLMAGFEPTISAWLEAVAPDLGHDLRERDVPPPAGDGRTRR